MTNSVDPDQLASSEANWSGSTLFVKTLSKIVVDNKAELALNLFIQFLMFRYSISQNPFVLLCV